MKVAGIILIVIGLLSFLIGLLVSYNALTSTYSKEICEQYVRDEKVRNEARKTFGNTSSDLYKEATKLATIYEADCERAKLGERNQLIIGIVITILGVLFLPIGFIFTLKKSKAY